jgi:hypothetical protein
VTILNQIYEVDFKGWQALMDCLFIPLTRLMFLGRFSAKSRGATLAEFRLIFEVR